MSRCIDADSLEELFREVIGGIAKKPEMNGNLEHMVRASAMVIEMIQDAPTIEPEPCEDAVSRQDILDGAVTHYSVSGANIAYRNAVPVEYIESLPSVQPKRKKGRWIKKTIKKKIENDYSCSECGRHVSVMRGYDVRLVYPFCHCGAEMRGDADE